MRREEISKPRRRSVSSDSLFILVKSSSPFDKILVKSSTMSRISFKIPSSSRSFDKRVAISFKPIVAAGVFSLSNLEDRPVPTGSNS